MNNITLRDNYLESNTIDSIDEYDLGSLKLNDFDFGECQTLMVRAKDYCRPDIISYRAYGTTNYWWFLMWFNGITDISNDLHEGVLIKYPRLDKVREALKEQ